MSFHPIKAVGQFFSDVGELGSTLIEDPQLFADAAEYTFTGHVNHVEKAIVNTPHARQLVSDIQNIGTKGIGNCKDEIHAALQDLASVKGFEYIGQLSPDAFDGALDSLGSYCTEISSQLNSAINAMEQYQNASVGANILSSMGTLSLKVAEGIGRFGEMIIDGGGLLVGGAVNLFDKDAGAAVKDFVGYDLVGNCDWMNRAYDAYEELGSISRDCASSQIAVVVGETAAFGEVSKGLQAVGKGIQAGTGIEAIEAAEGAGKLTQLGVKAANVGIKGLNVAGDVFAKGATSAVWNPAMVATGSTFGGSGAELAAEGKGYGEIFKEAGTDALVAGATTAVIAKGVQMAAESDIRSGRMIDKAENAEFKAAEEKAQAQKEYAKAEKAYNDYTSNPDVLASDDEAIRLGKQLDKAQLKLDRAQAKLDGKTANVEAAKAQQDYLKQIDAERTGIKEKLENIGKDAKEMWENKGGKDYAKVDHDKLEAKFEDVEAANAERQASLEQINKDISELEKQRTELGEKALKIDKADLDANNKALAEVEKKIQSLKETRAVYETKLEKGLSLEKDLEKGLKYNEIRTDISDNFSGIKDNMAKIGELKAGEPTGLYTGYTEEVRTGEILGKEYKIPYLQSTQPQRAVDLIAGGLGNIDRDKVMDASMKPKVDVQIGSDKVFKPEPTKPTPDPTNPTKPTPDPVDPTKPTPNPFNPEPTKPTPEPTNPTPDPVNPNPTNPDPFTPEPTNPDPTNPEPTNPTPTNPEPTNPEPTNPDPITPEPTNPDPITPEPTNPTPTNPEPTNPEPTNPTPTNPEPTNPDPGNNPTNVYNPANDNNTGSSHTGGGYTETGGYTPSTGGTNTTTPTTKKPTTSIDDIVKGNKYTKVPTSTTPITPKQQGNGLGNVIPIAAGLSAAAAAGIGAKAYLDRKKNNDNGEYDDENDEFGAEEWNGDENTIEVDYDDSSDTNTEQYLDDDDEFGAYQDSERYGARNNEELADLQ